MKTTIIYNLLETYPDGDTYAIRNGFPTHEAAKKRAEYTDIHKETVLSIVKVTTIRETVETFTLQPIIKTVEEIAQDIISYSDGSYDIAWDDTKDLSDEDKQKVQELVYEEITNCGDCGWHWHTDSLEFNGDSGEMLCWYCSRRRSDEEEEEP